MILGRGDRVIRVVTYDIGVIGVVTHDIGDRETVVVAHDIRGIERLGW